MISDGDKLKRLYRRSFLLGASKFFLTLIVFSKLYYLQILKKSKYGKLSDLNRTKVKVLYPERGTIFDLSGKPIASNRPDFQLTLFREKKDLIDTYILKLEKIIRFSDYDLSQLKKNVFNDNKSDFIVLKRNLSWEELEIFELVSYKFPFLFITKEKVRDYAKNLSFSHVIGYVGYKSDISNKKLLNLKVGVSGVEKLYDKKLLGSHGWKKMEANSTGRVMKTLKQENSKKGKNIKTNLITELQEFSFNQLKGMSGSVVMVNCINGGVNCMVSSPSFDNNEFSDGVSKTRWQSLINDHQKPLLNKSISGLYSPGSTLKLLTALYAISELDYNPKKYFFCTGFVELGSHKFHCWKRKGHGNVNLFDAIKQSCDCYFYNLAKYTNINVLSKVCKEFSIGKLTNVDMPNELKGIMPDSKWKSKNRGEKWHLGETLNTVIGQGFTLSTPLQLATMTARIASGRRIQPKIVREKGLSFDKLNFDESKLNFIRKSMFAVVNEYKGTAFASKLNSRFSMAGKTGTSQVRRISLIEREDGVLENSELPYQLRDHSIFTCYAPYDKPKFSLAVLVEHMGSGSKVAAPIAKKIMELALKKYI